MRKKSLIIFIIYFSVILFLFALKFLNSFLVKMEINDIKAEIDYMYSVCYNELPMNYYREHFLLPKIREKVKKYLRKNPDNLCNNYYLFENNLYKNGKSESEQYYDFFYEAIKRENYRIAKDCFQPLIYKVSESYSHKIYSMINIIMSGKKDYSKENLNSMKSDIDWICKISSDYYNFLKSTEVIKYMGRSIAIIFFYKNIYDIFVNGKIESMKSLKSIAEIYDDCFFDLEEYFDFRYYFEGYHSLLRRISEILDKKSKKYSMIIKEMKKYKNLKKDDLPKIKRNKKRYREPFFIYVPYYYEEV